MSTGQADDVSTGQAGDVSTGQACDVSVHFSGCPYVHTPY